MYSKDVCTLFEDSYDCIIMLLLILFLLSLQGNAMPDGHDDVDVDVLRHEQSCCPLYFLSMRGLRRDKMHN